MRSDARRLERGESGKSPPVIPSWSQHRVVSASADQQGHPIGCRSRYSREARSSGCLRAISLALLSCHWLGGCLLLVDRDVGGATDDSPTPLESPTPPISTPAPLEPFLGIWEYSQSSGSVLCDYGPPVSISWDGLVTMDRLGNEISVVAPPSYCMMSFTFDYVNDELSSPDTQLCHGSFTDPLGHIYSYVDYEFPSFSYSVLSAASLSEEREVVVRYLSNNKEVSCSGSASSTLVPME